MAVIVELFTSNVCSRCVPAKATLLLACGLGRSVLILVGAWGLGWLESVIPLARYHRMIEAAGGITLILTGLYLLNQYFLII